MKKLLLFAILFTALFTSCSENKNASLIIGKWQATQWLTKDKAINNDIVIFTFDNKAGYVYENNGTIEKGTYKIDNNSLYTTAEKQQEIMVNITKLTTDSLTFEMNRGGQAETLILVKAK
jgi:Lipocalin-like domain